MSENNLYDDDAKQKIKEMAESIDFAMMATALSEQPIHMVPMSTKRVDDQGHIWFLSSKTSQHNRNLGASSHLQLVYVDKSAMQFLTVYGTARVTQDAETLKSLYGATDGTWFDGVDDPILTAIEVQPQVAYYWDPKSNKLVTLLKMATGAITGKEPDLMHTGKLKP